MMRVRQSPLLPSLATLILFTLLVCLPLGILPGSDLLAAEPPDASVHSEPLLLAQQRLLESSLASILHGKRKVTDLYYVGFGGDGSQDVFLKELEYIEQLFRDRFAAAGRPVTLVNNTQTDRTRPLASVAALSRTLARIGSVMNRDEDILFLYLTSHGTPEPLLRVQNNRLELDQIDPRTLRRMLDESGILWRVIVVSSCFSGGFLGELTDERSLVISASAADRESFGCSNDADFTWFGRAYFNMALQETYSFAAAFDRAKEIVSQWEKEQGEKPSAPQISMGTKIGNKLALLEKRLTGLASAAAKGTKPADCPARSSRKRR